MRAIFSCSAFFSNYWNKKMHKSLLRTRPLLSTVSYIKYKKHCQPLCFRVPVSPKWVHIQTISRRNAAPQDVQHPPTGLHGAVLTGGTTSVTTAASPSQHRGAQDCASHRAVPASPSWSGGEQVKRGRQGGRLREDFGTKVWGSSQLRNLVYISCT